MNRLLWRQARQVGRVGEVNGVDREVKGVDKDIPNPGGR